MEMPLAAKATLENSGNLTGQIILILVLTAINAFFSAAEMSMVSVNKNKLKNDADDGDKKAAQILRVLSDQSNLLSVIQVVITFSGLFNSAAAATGISVKLSNYLNSLGVPYSFTFSQIIFTTILSYITIVFGELVPKRVAIVKSEEFARFAVKPIIFVNFVFNPFVVILTFSTNLVLKLVGIKTENLEGKITINDIKSMLQLGQSQGVIDQVESEMINSVIEFDETTAEEVMTPRTEVFMIDINDDFTEYKEEMLSLKYSRIPVYDGDIDNIIGLLYLKDFLLESYSKGFKNVDISKIVKPAYFVPERKNINELFAELQRKNRHMALLIDEYGGFAGLVTMEDLVEEIMGNIDDEYDNDDPEVLEISDDVYRVKASISIKDFNNITGSELDEDSEDFDTIGGLIINELGYIPVDGETPYIDIDNVGIQVLEVENKKIQNAEITVYDDFTHQRPEGEDNEEG